MEYRYVCIRKELFFRFLNDFDIVSEDKNIKKYKKDNNTIIVEEYDNNLIIVISKEKLESKALIDVTDNELYLNDNIDNLIVTNVVIEGTDGVGKTSTIEGLIKRGIVCFDRDLEICKYMLFDVSLEDRCSAYMKYLEENTYTIVFLVNNSKEELERRIMMRENISEFDKMAFEYNNLYKETYEAMKKITGRIMLVDCTNLSLAEQIDEVERKVMGIIYE